MNKSDAVLLLETYKKEANEYTEEYSFLLPVIEFLLTGDAELPEMPETDPEPETISLDRFVSQPGQTEKEITHSSGTSVKFFENGDIAIFADWKKTLEVEISFICRKYQRQYPNYMPEQIWADMQQEICELVMKEIDKRCQK